MSAARPKPAARGFASSARPRHFDAKGTATKRIVAESRLTNITSTFDAHGNVILAGSEIPMENNEHLHPRGHVERFVASAPSKH